MDNINENVNEVTVDPVRLNKMLVRIYSLERKNSKTGKFGETRIKEEIQKIIEEEVKKCF